MALIPGISRSASTISCANVLGWSAKEAVRFSFLLSIPTVLGGSALELFKFARSSVPLSSLSFSSCLIGFTSSCMVGLIVIQLAIGVLERGYLRPFAWYCLSLGLLTSLYLNLF
jgi:undecaprenyl-diphosphatase